MTADNVQTLIGIGVYLVVMIAIGLWYAQRSNTDPEEYFLAKRGFGPWVAALSAEASDMSGWLLMGLPGVAYFTGYGEAFWTALGLFIGTWINWAVVAKRLRSYSQIADNAITLPEFFSKRFHDKKRILLALAAVISLVFFSIYVGAQFITFGKLFSYIFNANMVAMVILGAFMVMLYTLLGGFMAVGMTDLIQGLLMVGALLLVLVFGFFNAGGISGIAQNLAGFPRFTDFFGIATPDLVDGAQRIVNGVPQFGPGADYGFLTIISTMAWGLGYFGMPQVLVRFMAIKKTSMIGTSRNIAVIWCFIAQIAAVLIGIIGRAYLPGLLTTAAEAENIFTHLGIRFFPPLIAGVVISGILAASMSSSDSYMLIVSSSLANDIFKDILKKDASDALVMWVARLAMLLVTIFGIGIALSGNQSIFRVVSYAWAGFGASFGPLILFSLFWKRTTFPAAVAGMLTGGVMVVLWKNVVSKLGGIFAVYELLPAFILSAAVILVVSLVTPKPSTEIEKEFESAKTAEF
ncbi:MAG: sodium/proline symporter [Spirochaetaceae bacterium]|jgi:sodium/proline symporter|nr:sodium/proline symporter [Spirochaetaceae bacterium]